MNKIQIENLKKIIAAEYPHICLNGMDINVITIVPSIERNFLPFRGRELFTKKGFFNNGKTTLWSDYKVKPGHIKIAERLPTSAEVGAWSDAFSFQEEGAEEVIARLMKLKAFW